MFMFKLPTQFTNLYFTNSQVPRKFQALTGFTLAELLICLAILGTIATFTIPKVIASQQSGKNNAIIHETAAMLSEAYQLYKYKNTLTTGTLSTDFTQYMNYVKVETGINMDDTPAGTTVPCGTYYCLRLHNGAIMSTQLGGESFNGTNTTNGVIFLVDPDGQANSVKAVLMAVMYDGRVVSQGTCNGSIVSTVYTYPCNPSRDPSWFKW